MAVKTKTMDVLDFERNFDGWKKVAEIFPLDVNLVVINPIMAISKSSKNDLYPILRDVIYYPNATLVMIFVS